MPNNQLKCPPNKARVGPHWIEKAASLWVLENERKKFVSSICVLAEPIFGLFPNWKNRQFRPAVWTGDWLLVERQVGFGEDGGGGILSGSRRCFLAVNCCYGDAVLLLGVLLTLKLVQEVWHRHRLCSTPLRCACSHPNQTPENLLKKIRCRRLPDLTRDF